MPIKIPDKLPAREVLENENIFVMTEKRARTQDMRPLRILLLNLMPTKITTETQLSRLLGNTPLQVELTLLQVESHVPKHTSAEHMLSFYKVFSDVSDENFDGMVITGAPIENLPFEQVTYWDELCWIMEWSKSHVHSTFHICWGAQAGLYYHFGIGKHPLGKKLFGVYPHKVIYRNPVLLRGFDDVFYVPHSRYTASDTEAMFREPRLKILASSPEAGVYAAMTANGRQIFISGHSEYDADTLRNEYLRDRNAGLDTPVPENYFPMDDPENPPIVRWRGHANLLYSNWLNYFVYQTTPYDLTELKSDEQ